jgi:hypothetical protein
MLKLDKQHKAFIQRLLFNFKLFRYERLTVLCPTAYIIFFTNSTITFMMLNIL